MANPKWARQEPGGYKELHGITPPQSYFAACSADPVGRIVKEMLIVRAYNAMVGRHKVVVMSLRVGNRNMVKPMPAHYHDASTTPLEVEVTSGCDHNNFFEIKGGP